MIPRAERDRRKMPRIPGQPLRAHATLSSRASKEQFLLAVDNVNRYGIALTSNMELFHEGDSITLTLKWPRHRGGQAEVRRISATVRNVRSVGQRYCFGAEFERPKGIFSSIRLQALRDLEMKLYQQHRRIA